MTIGIYGGTFDPIHTGHSMVANFVSQCGVVDEVWLLVNKKNPLKIQNSEAPELSRLEMAGLVASNCKNVRVCDIEMSLPSPSYSYDTLMELKRLYPENSFKMILGSDSYQGFSHWKENDRIQKEFGLIVYPRPGYSLPQREPENTIFLNGAPEFSISSSLIREYVKSGWNINYFVPTVVAEYIMINRLYK